MIFRILESICGVIQRRSALPLATKGTQERGEVIRIMGITQEAIRSTRYRIQQNMKK